jgi:hypothetical protein
VYIYAYIQAMPARTLWAEDKISETLASCCAPPDVVQPIPAVPRVHSGGKDWGDPPERPKTTVGKESGRGVSNSEEEEEEVAKGRIDSGERPGAAGGSVEVRGEHNVEGGGRGSAWVEDAKVCGGERVGEEMLGEGVGGVGGEREGGGGGLKAEEAQKKRVQLLEREEEMGAQGEISRGKAWGKEREGFQVRELGFDVPTLLVCALGDVFFFGSS